MLTYFKLHLSMCIIVLICISIFIILKSFFFQNIANIFENQYKKYYSFIILEI